MNAHKTTRMVPSGRPIDTEESMTRHALKEHETMGRITRRLLLAVTLALVVALPVLLQPVSARAAGEILDQSQTGEDTYQLAIGGQMWSQVAQIVTAGHYGFLHGVSIYIDNRFATGPIIVSIQTVIDGLPSGIEIGQGTIPVEDLPPQYGDPQWVDVVISGGLGLAMAPGTQYAIVLSEASGIAQWHGSPDVYSGGYFAVNNGKGWSSVTNADTMFQTYVIPDELDQANNWSYGYDSWEPGQQFGQTFTAGMSGVLDRVDVSLYAVSFTPNPAQVLHASIQTVNEDGYPSGMEIGHGSIPGTAIPCYPHFGAWAEIGITSNKSVLIGTQYAIVLTYSQEPELEACIDLERHYGGGAAIFNGGGGWTTDIYGDGKVADAAFKTYVARPIMYSPPPPPPPPIAITPCSADVCPEVAGTVTPNDSTARVTSNVQFRERPDGTVHGILNFNGSRTGDLALKGCVTDSAACRLTVTTFACTDQHAITVKGTFTPQGESAASYRLTLSGVKDGIGTFTLKVGDYTYTLTHYGIVDVTCP